MKPWQKALGSIRLMGPDIPPFREDVKLVNDHIEELELEKENTRRAGLVLGEALKEAEAKAKVLERNNEHLSTLLDARQNDAFEAEAEVVRLRKREAQLRADSADTYARERSSEARVVELERHDQAATQDAVFFRKRMVRFEEVLGEIESDPDRPAHTRDKNGFVDLARSTLTHEEEKE